MKRFEFRLQPLLEYRQYLEKLAQQNTARAQMDVKKSRYRIAELEQIRDNSREKVENIVINGISASEFQQYQQYLAALDSGIMAEKSRKAQLSETLKKKLVELKQKSIDKKVMEFYKKRVKENYDHDMRITEQKEIDEIVSIKTARKRLNEEN